MSPGMRGPTSRATGSAREDEAADRLIAFLDAQGAAKHRHADRRTLLEHLIGTYDIVRHWAQPVWLQHAALIHSVYGTDVRRRALLPLSRRSDVIGLAGDRAERLAYLFCVTPRDALFAGTHRWARGFGHDTTNDPPIGRDELDGLVLLHMANLAEQARADDGSPGVWLVRLRALAELLIDSESVTLPLFIAELASLTNADESLSRRAYRTAIATQAPTDRASRLALAAAACPVVAEPCVWQADLARRRGNAAMAREWADRGRRRLTALGTAWDKRLTYEQWLELTRVLAQPAQAEPDGRAPADPRALFDETVHAEAPTASLERPRPATGTARFQRYMETLADADRDAVRGVYPDLPSQPWYDATTFPLANYLQAHFTEIREEILALDYLRFQRENERIPRSGDWDVAFLYERGRRRDDVCDACPVTTRGVEAHGAMRTAAGLIYVSRMRAGTHIRAHRGPTNLRLRCHLGVTVPRGDCAIRVGGETRHWTDGGCLVFDDYFEHEAWNHTDEDRIVLIADLWHPGLSTAEVQLLEGLHRYAYAYARQLNRYWAANAAAVRANRA